jgi:hypothetical protein
MAIISLREVLQHVGATYDRHHSAAYDQPAQVTLDNASELLAPLTPMGFRIGASGQKPFPLPVTPWIGFLNLDESGSFQNGIYVVYLFDAELEHVFLSLNQGTEDLRKKLRLSEKEQLSTLQTNALAIRGRFAEVELAATAHRINLKSDLPRPRSYEAGNIAAIEYRLDELPPNEVLVRDLQGFMGLYERALQIRNQLVLEKIDGFAGVHNNPALVEQIGLGGFNPKNDSDYVADIKGRQIIKSRRHEKLVKLFGDRSSAIGFVPTTPHPIDVLLSRGDKEWIAELKIVYDRNFSEAVRGAIGQLMEYRHFIKPSASQIAVFDQPINEAFTGLLNSLGISVIYLEGGCWKVHSTDAALISFVS